MRVFEQSLSAEGFLTREHEQMRLVQGRETVRRFYARQLRDPETPTLIEEPFKFPLDDMMVVGRWDRVDVRSDEVVIIDYKSSEMNDQQAANRRTQESMQLLIYALAWQQLHGQVPTRLEIVFLETDLVGRATVTLEDLEQAKRVLREAADGIRRRDFQARPHEHACRWCAFQSICSFAFQAS